MNDTRTNSGAAAIPYRIKRTYLGEIEDNEKIDSVEAGCAFAGGDYALKYIPPKLHLFRVIEQEAGA